MSDQTSLPVLEHADQLGDLTDMPGYVLADSSSEQPHSGLYSCSYCGVGDSGLFAPDKDAPDGGWIRNTVPTVGCVKLGLSRNVKPPVFPFQTTPSFLDRKQGHRKTLNYPEAIGRFADLLLEHRPPQGRTLVYGCGQIDYFTIFAIQEVFRLLGVRNLTGNAEHCLNAGAIHNEMLTGQEGPFLTIAQALRGDNRFYLFNGWNGSITHPPAFAELMKREQLDAYLVEVVETESARELIERLGEDRVLLIRPRTDPHLALAVAHEILSQYPQAVESRFIEKFSDTRSFDQFSGIARSEQYTPSQVAARVAPEPEYMPRLEAGIRDIARKLADPETIPINIPSVGLSQTSGVVAHCLWGSVLAMLGKYGLRPDGTPAGGTLRLAGQINAETEVQGLSRKYFMGRIPMDQAAEAAQRMGLPDNAYAPVLEDIPRAALDYSEPTPGVRELFVFLGTQFEANMMGRHRWLRKLQDPDNRMVVIDPIADPFTLEHADLIIPSPPHAATTKVYQNGEWKLSLSIPHKKAPPETRSDPTILYDVMAEIGRRLEADAELAAAHPDLARHVQSGYLRARFMLPEVSEEPFESAAPTQMISTPQTLSIGRLRSNDIMLTHPTISRQHAVLTCIDRIGRRFRIEDAGSTNGVYKNGERVKSADFTLEDRITLGDVEFMPDKFLPLFSLEEQATRQDASATQQDKGLARIDGEVSRAVLWDRIMDYMSGGSGPLYCRPEHADQRPIRWQEMLEKGSIIYGGVGTHRYRLDYQNGETPFADVFRKPRSFTFFIPSEADLAFPEGVILNSGRSSLSADKARIRFATASFNSGKATPAADMPDENPVHISPLLARRFGLKNGDHVRLTGRETGDALALPVEINERVKGESLYVSFHKSRAQIEKGHYVNNLTAHTGRCPYCAQTNLKASQVLVERLGAHPVPRVSADTTLHYRPSPTVHIPVAEPVDTTLIDPKAELPIWQGEAAPLTVTDIVQETQDVFTFRFQGDPLCRFVYWPGQYCTLILNIDGKKVRRSYSISSPPTRPFVLEITVKRVGGGLASNWLVDNVKVGDRIDIDGPRGKFCLVPGKIPRKILFLSAGSGITPLMSMARWLCDVSAHVDIRFFNSVRTPGDIIFQRELELLTSRYKIFSPIVVTSTRSEGSGWLGMSGRISGEMLDLIAPDLHERHVFMCGPEGFMEAARELLTARGFDLNHLHAESFGPARTVPAEPVAPPGTGGFRVAFTASGKEVVTEGKIFLLDLAESQDIDIDYTCRSGSCGDCKARLVDGDVKMACEDGLTAEEKDAGYILTCVARPSSDCTLEA
jgi:ferredoxin-NADP reductase/anaerobic selenocysteine-containing dehydrogenase